jgi:hypothetical protein
MSGVHDEFTEDVQDDSALILWLAVLLGICTMTLSWWWLVRISPSDKKPMGQQRSQPSTTKPVTTNNNKKKNKKKAAKQAQSGGPVPAPSPSPPLPSPSPPLSLPQTTTIQVPTTTSATNKITNKKKQQYLILAVLWIATVILSSYASRVLQQSTFNPYTILGVSTAASLQEIKKTYRKLSLEYHPDRWAQKSTSNNNHSGTNNNISNK